MGHLLYQAQSFKYFFIHIPYATITIIHKNDAILNFEKTHKKKSTFHFYTVINTAIDIFQNVNSVCG